MAGPNHSEGIPPYPPAPTPTLAELSGTTLDGRYELGRVLGTGGMGAVFEARHLLLGRLVAIKVLRPIFVDQDEYIERFLREAKAASMIRHRNVVEILDCGRTSTGFVYSVMELLRGQDLHQLLKSQASRRLPWAYACSLLIQIANGLKAAHAQGVIHRDIKPANCFITENEDGEQVVKIVDFGVAKLEDADRAQQLTSTAQLLGTPNYIAPELVRTKSPASPRSDIYSLGVLAYRVLTGHVPFSGDTIFEVLRLSCFEPVPSLCDQVPGLPLALEALVIQMLAKEPHERPQDMMAVREALLAIGRDTPGANAFDPAPAATESAVLEPAELITLATPVVPDLTDLADPSTINTTIFPHSGGAATPDLPASYPSFAAPVPVAIPSGHPIVVASHHGRDAGPPLEARGSSSRPVWLAAAAVLGTIAAVAFALWATLPQAEEARADEARADEARAPEPPASPRHAEATIQAPPAAPIPEPEAKPAAPANPATDASAPPSSAPSDPRPEPAATGASDPPAPGPKLGPSDSSLKKKLTKKITERCGSLMKGGSLEITLIVVDDGEVALIKTIPNDAAGRCAATEIKGTKFRRRSGETKVVFTVK